MESTVGWPANPGHLISRNDAQFSNSDYIQLDIGGEGYHEVDSIVSGFNSAINVNAQTQDSQPPYANIPHLVLVKNWQTNPKYPFRNGFADYMTMQCAPLTSTNVTEFVRCIQPGGEIGLWVDDDSAIQKTDRLNTYVEWKACMG